ncbi:MAG: PKD domain-containing protein [Bacteroidia bacterium]|nr:PKD domain-containing protein [Bacteroidia bacterium]
MKTFTKKLIFAATFLVATISVKSQVVYSEDFGPACTTTFPGSWTTGSTTSDWLIDDNSTSCGGGVPECNVGGSSGGSMLAGADGSSGTENAVTAFFSTTGVTNITLDWNGYRSTGAPTLVLEYSFDDNTYTNIAFTDVTTDDAWHAVSQITLPVACENVSVLYLRFSYAGTGGGAFIAIDDIIVQGASAPIFYWNGTGGLHLTTSWGKNLNGTGTQPPDFTTTGQVFNLYNNTATLFTPVLTADWAVSGGSVSLNIGDGATRNTNFTIPSTFSLSLSGATMTIPNASTLTLQNTVMPTAGLVVLSAGSTIDYAQTSVVTMYNKAYSNLTISGGANKTQAGSTSVSGVLNLSSSTSNLNLINGTLLTFSVIGTVTGPGSIVTGTNPCRFFIGGTGALGTLRFSGTNAVNLLTINRTSSGVITLGSNLTVGAGTLTPATVWTNGNIALNGNHFTMRGAITFPASASNGAFTATRASSVTIAGTGAITNTFLLDQTSAATRGIGDITLNRSGATLSFANQTDVWGSITPLDGAIAGANLTIKGDALNKGRIGITPATGTVTGFPTIEVFKNAGVTGWVNLCSGGVVNKTFADWNTSFAITCSTCPDGWVVNTSTFTSVYSYDETTFVGNSADASHYIDIDVFGGISANIDPIQGYWVFLGNGFPNTTAITIPLQGNVYQQSDPGSLKLNLASGIPATEDGWNLIANPYASPILVQEMLNDIGASNVDNTFLVYDPDTDANIPYTASGTNSVIPTGQAFMVRTFFDGIAFTPTENYKTLTASSVGIQKTSAGPAYYFNDFLLDLTSSSVGKTFFTQAYFTFENGNTKNFDNGKDAISIASSVDPGTPRIISVLKDDKYMRNALPSINGTVVIPVLVNTGYAGVYTIKPENFNRLPAGACVTLYDIAKSTSHDLKSGPYTTTISAWATTPQYELRITVNPTTLNSSSSNALCTKNPNGKIIASGTTGGPWNYVWKDASSNVIKTTNSSMVADTLKNIGAGTYFVDVNTVSTCDNANASFNIVVTSPLPVAGFAPNADSLDINGSTPFVFTNSSVNASNYTWSFGDGNTSTLTSPTHTYNTTGDYNVSLSAVNPTCGDSSSFNYFVKVYGTVSSPTLQSVASIAASDNNIKIGKDANGIYVQFNYDKNTRGTVTVTNVLGQVLVAPKAIEGTTERFYIDVNVKDQLLFVTVTTGEKRITERLLSTQ